MLQKLNLIMNMVKDTSIISISDIDNPKIEYVILKRLKHIHISKYNWTKDRGLIIEWHIYDISLPDFVDCMVTDKIIILNAFSRNVNLTIGKEFEKYVEDNVE